MRVHACVSVCGESARSCAGAWFFLDASGSLGRPPLPAETFSTLIALPLLHPLDSHAGLLFKSARAAAAHTGHAGDAPHVEVPSTGWARARCAGEPAECALRRVCAARVLRRRTSLCACALRAL